MIDKREFGRRLRYARERQGFSQSGMAKRLNLTKNAVGNWEQGHCYPNTGLIDELCAVLRVAPNWLFRPVSQVPPSADR